MTENSDEKPATEQIEKTEAEIVVLPDELNTNNLTLSTKISTDQLICKTPQESPSVSVKSLKTDDRKTARENNKNNVVLYLGSLQIIFGCLMAIFGILVIVHDASLAQIGGGIWGGCLAMATGTVGVLTSAQSLCPFKPTAQKVCHTVFLALSLISIAVAQLVVVITATGLARDVNNVEADETHNQITDDPGKVSLALPSNYPCLLYSIALLISATIECICAAVAAYKSSRDLCPCFKRSEDLYKDNLNLNNSHALVSSWLGKQSPPGHIYFVGPPSSMGTGGKLSGGMPITPIYALPAPMMQPQIFGYPLIPAPLGPVPSPIIPPPSRREMMHKIHKKYKTKSRQTRREATPTRPRSRTHPKERPVTEEDMVRTYTGLDRAIAEEFIDICDSKNTSLCSDLSCTSSNCQSPCDIGCNTNSDAASQDYLVNKI